MWKLFVKECFVKLIESEGLPKECFVFLVYRVSENADAVALQYSLQKLIF